MACVLESFEIRLIPGSLHLPTGFMTWGMDKFCFVLI